MNSITIGRRTALAALGATAAWPLLPAAVRATTPAESLRALLEQSALADALLNPLSGDAPLPADAPVFVDPLSDAYAAQLAANKRSDLAALRRIDRAGLPPTDRIAFDVLDFRTMQILAEIDGGQFDLARQVNFDPSFGLHVEFPDLVAGTALPFATRADYDRGIARLEGFAAYLDSALAQSRRGRSNGHLQYRGLLAQVLAQVDAMLALPIADTPFYAPIKRMPAGIAEPKRAQIAAAYRATIEAQVRPAYARWQAYLRAYLPAALDQPGRWAMKDGDRLYAAELARHTTTTLSANAIHKLGLSEVARIRAEMEAVRVKVGFKGTLAAFFDHIRTDPRYYFKRPEELLASFAEIQTRIWAGMPRLFADRPSAPFEVRPLPALGEQRGTGYYRPGPPDGRSPGILFFNMAMLGTRPIPTMETLTLHEGIPGHHYQINLARENRALPDLLRFQSFTAYSEGWGLYSESLGRDLGLFTDPMQWFGHLDMEMLRAVRLAVDTGIHAKRWSRQRAIDYMLANTSMAPRDVAVEIDRYIAAPGQACAYKIGELKLHELRRKSAAALGSRFDIRAFHRQVLETGSLPLAVLERKLGEWAGFGGYSNSTMT